MLCKKPYAGRGSMFGCGQCLPCRINRRRQWKWRQWFESLSHKENCFVTLTYDKDHLPPNGSLSAEDLRGFLHRLRASVAPLAFRYYAVGEYGDLSQRPHYHLSLFGMSGDTRVRYYGREALGRDAIYSAWKKCDPNKGFSVFEFNEVTAEYVCGYVTKKLTSHDDPRLQGRAPEFARMSLRPGIGAPAMDVVARALADSDAGRALVHQTGDVPGVLKVGSRSIQLARYLRKALRRAVGFSPAQIDLILQRASYANSIEMSDVLRTALAYPDAKAPRVISSSSLYHQRSHQKIRQLETKFNIVRSGRSL